jgi:hypothetical protein
MNFFESDDALRRFTDPDFLVPVLIFAGIVCVVGIRSLASVIRGVARERTRREIAAFIAEGSMTPEQGERLMKAGGKDA